MAGVTRTVRWWADADASAVTALRAPSGFELYVSSMTVIPLGVDWTVCRCSGLGRFARRVMTSDAGISNARATPTAQATFPRNTPGVLKVPTGLPCTETVANAASPVTCTSASGSLAEQRMSVPLRRLELTSLSPYYRGPLLRTPPPHP